jgi:hypothetical protein
MPDWRVTDPLVAAAIKAGGLLSNVMPQGMMTPVRVLDETMSGSNKPLTANDITPEQQQFLKSLIEHKELKNAEYAKKFGEGSRFSNPNAVAYSDYYNWWKDQPEDSRPEIKNQGMQSLLTPYGQMQTTLGQFNYKKDPKTGDIKITDTYNFNPLETSKDESDLGVYGAIREYAGRQLPEGSGRPVSINLLGDMPKKKKQSLLD